MMQAQQSQSSDGILDQEPPEVLQMQAAFGELREAYFQDPYPSLETRLDRLNRLNEALNQYSDRIIEAIDQDFNGRMDLLTHMGDVFAPRASIKYTRKHLRQWMKPEKRRLEFPYNLLGYKGEVHYQPKGVVGVIAPWNGPVALSLIPVINAISAGNRIMLKPSGQTANTEILLAEMIEEFFAPDEIRVVTGRGRISRAFPELPFDHIVFTGGPVVARDVMAAAARNLTPVTLELGGKCPVYVSGTADIETAAQRIVAGKMVNTGQVCVSPDYAFVPKQGMDQFIQAAREKVGSMYPEIAGNRDYTAMFGGKSQHELLARIEQARERGATVVPLAHESYGIIDGNKLAPVIVVDPEEDTELMQHESFGPILIVKSYDDIQQVIDYVQHRPSPLVFYYFGKDHRERKLLTEWIRAGNMSINDVVLNVFVNSLPFGGVGESGIGRYYGKDGFQTLSNRKGTITKGFVYINKYIQPPFSDKYRETAHRVLKKL